MKRIVLICLIVLQFVYIAGCSSRNSNAVIINSNSMSPETTVPNNSKTTEIMISIDALHFQSEQQMIAQILSGEKSNTEHKLELIEYYFHPTKLPEGARLVDIRVKAFYVALLYVIGEEKPDMAKNEFTFVWYRTMRGDDMKNGCTNAGLPWEPMLKNNAYSFYTSENYALDSEGNIDKNIPPVQMCKVIQWVQNDYCFHVNAPLTFTEDDALEFCIAEKVVVK